MFEIERYAHFNFRNTSILSEIKQIMFFIWLNDKKMNHQEKK